jgi:hypothetical protein
MVLGLTNQITMFIKTNHTALAGTGMVLGLSNQITMFIKTNITLHKLVQVWC